MAISPIDPLTGKPRVTPATNLPYINNPTQPLPIQQQPLQKPAQPTLQAPQTGVQQLVSQRTEELLKQPSLGADTTAQEKQLALEQADRTRSGALEGLRRQTADGEK